MPEKPVYSLPMPESVPDEVSYDRPASTSVSDAAASATTSPENAAPGSSTSVPANVPNCTASPKAGPDKPGPFWPPETRPDVTSVPPSITAPAPP